jgi:hypothetical protein
MLDHSESELQKLMARSDPLTRMIRVEPTLRMIRLLRDEWEQDNGRGYSQATKDFCWQEIAAAVTDQ